MRLPRPARRSPGPGMTAQDLGRAGHSTDVGELVGGAGRGIAAGTYHGDVYGAGAGRTCGGNLSIGVHRHRGAYATEIDRGGISESAARDGNAGSAGFGTTG